VQLIHKSMVQHLDIEGLLNAPRTERFSQVRILFYCMVEH
jgi:hypothetical protein